MIDHQDIAVGHALMYSISLQCFVEEMTYYKERREKERRTLSQVGERQGCVLGYASMDLRLAKFSAAASRSLRRGDGGIKDQAGARQNRNLFPI